MQKSDCFPRFQAKRPPILRFSVPSFNLPEHNRQVQLVRRPYGVPQADDFAISTLPRPEPREGEVLLRNLMLSVDPAQRGWASSEANYATPVALGSPMRALAMGVVIASRNEIYAEGDVLYGFFGWQDYACASSDQILLKARHPLSVEAHLALFGISGMTAYLALTRCGRPEAGDVLVVSTAAGSVGSLVGQLGKRLGCHTIGLTGSDEKVKRCLERYGYDQAFNYKTINLSKTLQEASPKGVDVYFDNTGGDILDTVLRQMRIGGRIVQCGTASVPSWSPLPQGPRNEREIMTRRLIWSGFIVLDHKERFEVAADDIARMVMEGELHYDIHVLNGLHEAPNALNLLYSGGNHGKLMITLE
jgi:NADPH-dependent curcumin reductase CurA